MKNSRINYFVETGLQYLRRPWQTFKDGQIWYGVTKLGSKRHPLTSKQGRKGFYKGTGSSGYGKNDKNGIYRMNWNKVRTYYVPQGLEQTNLKGLVSANTPQIKQKYIGYQDEIKDGLYAFNNAVEFVEEGKQSGRVKSEIEYLETYENDNKE